jgi:hypothetical protein
MPALPFSPVKFSALIDRVFAADNRATVRMSQNNPSKSFMAVACNKIRALGQSQSRGGVV